MRKRLIIAVLGIPATAVVALTTNIISAPFDYVRSLLSKQEIGSELHVKLPPNYPAIEGLVITRVATGTNVDILGR